MDDLMFVGAVALLSAALSVLAVWWVRRRLRARSEPCRNGCQLADTLDLKGGACYRECYYAKLSKDLR